MSRLRDDDPFGGEWQLGRPILAAVRRALGGPRRWTTRLLLAVLVCLPLFAIVVPRIGSAQKQTRLFVFVTTDIRPHALEQELTAALPGVQVRVFGRSRELQAAVQREAPEAVLARPVVLESLRLKPILRGSRKGSTQERYVLLSVRRALQPSELSNQALGVVDLVGRNEMKAFVSRVLGVPAPKLKFVTTEHDLLPLLQFGEAVAVLAPEQWVSVLQKKSNLDLRTTVLTNTVQLPAFWYAGDSVRGGLEPKVKTWKPELNSKLGIDEWK